MRIYALFGVFILSPLSAQEIDVFACEPEWASLVEELAGDAATVTVATTAYQDPHRLQAIPSLIAAVRQADLIVCTGADLEVGWLPLLLRRAGDANIQAGSPGYFMASDFVRKLEVPKVIDRSQGDIHPQGNPHVHLDPRNIRRVADALAERFTELDAANASNYAARLTDFQARWSTSMALWEERAVPLAGMRLASHHRSFSYLANWLHLDIVANLESKPGVPPSGAQLGKILEKLNANPPVAVIRTPYENEKPSLWLSERLEIPALRLPYTTGSDPEVMNLFSLFETTLTMLEEQMR